MIMMPGISINNLVIANLLPKADISNRNIGILVVDQAPMKISTSYEVTVKA